MAKTVVLVEDDASLCEILRVGLESRGLRVQSAGDGVAGLALIRKARPDAVLLDIKMPKMNGYQLCAALQSDADTRAIPILIMTGLTTEEGQQQDDLWRERLGVADFISKPFEVSVVVDRIFAVLERAGLPSGS